MPPTTQTCNFCSWKFSTDPRHTKSWQTHARERHSQETLAALTANLPANWKKQIRCESCKTIVTDHHSAIIQHAQSCVNENAMNDTKFRTRKDLFPDSCYTTSFMHTLIRPTPKMNTNANRYDPLSDDSLDDDDTLDGC